MSSSGQGGDPAWTVILFLAVSALFLWLFWLAFRVEILEALRYLRFAEMWVLNLFSDQKACLTWLKVVRIAPSTPTPEAVAATNACFGVDFLRAQPSTEVGNYYQLSAASIGAIGRGVAYYIRWPFMAFFAAMAVYAYAFTPRGKFRTKHNLESFIKIQSKMWPVISPIVNFNPIKSSARAPGQPVPDKLPLFAEALSPEEWISWHRIPVTNGIPDREATRRAFLLQLGPRWDGTEGLPPYIRALFVSFALRGVQKRDESDDLLSRVAVCWSAQGGLKLPFKLIQEIDRLIKDPEVGGKALEIANQHAYRTTALLGVLKWSRTNGGVLAPAQFLWLRGVDRVLWYPLNNLGRRSFHTEGAGAIAHFMAEQNAKKPLPIPRIDTAIVTLNQFLADPERRQMPIPPREEPKTSRT